MQFPVPQFTDVEDKIIGPLTLKQFGIVFGAGVVVFLGYSAGKSLTVLIILSVIFGLPAVIVALYKHNGRPLYSSFGQILRFFISSRYLTFHKEVYNLGTQNLKDVEVAPNQSVAEKKTIVQTPQDRLSEVRKLLEKQAAEERELLGKIK